MTVPTINRARDVKDVFLDSEETSRGREEEKQDSKQPQRFHWTILIFCFLLQVADELMICNNCITKTEVRFKFTVLRIQAEDVVVLQECHYKHFNSKGLGEYFILFIFR